MSAKKIIVNMELPELPAGYEYTGEYRKIRTGEYYLNVNGDVNRWNDHKSLFDYPIIKKVRV